MRPILCVLFVGYLFSTVRLAGVNFRNEEDGPVAVFQRVRPDVIKIDR